MQYCFLDRPLRNRLIRYGEQRMRRHYDTIEGISEYLTTLAGFNHLAKLRHEAGYIHKERLHDFYVLGNFYLDSCGNCMRAIKKATYETTPAEFYMKILGEVPKVVTTDEFRSFAKSHSTEDNHPLMTFTHEQFPQAHTVCSECEEPWTLENCHDVVVHHEMDNISLDEFTGMALRRVKEFFDTRPDAVYYMQKEIMILNPRYVDLTPDEYGRAKNQNGWADSDRLIGDQELDDVDNYVIHNGDTGHFNVWKFYHQTCNRIYLDREEREFFVKVFEDAGIDIIDIKPIPNEYCPCEMCAAWFTVVTPFGIIKIGWRKHVINIKFDGIRLDELFADEDVTKGPDFIHAWGGREASEYLKRMCDGSQALGKP